MRFFGVGGLHRAPPVRVAPPGGRAGPSGGAGAGAGEAGRRPLSLHPLTLEARPMSNRKPSRYTRALVLAGPALALLATILLLATGTGLRPLWAVWACSALWCLLTALSCVLWRGLRHGGLDGLSSLRTARRERRGLRVVRPDGPLFLAPRAGGAGTVRPGPGRTLPVEGPQAERRPP